MSDVRQPGVVHELDIAGVGCPDNPHHVEFMDSRSDVEQQQLSEASSGCIDMTWVTR